MASLANKIMKESVFSVTGNSDGMWKNLFLNAYVRRDSRVGADVEAILSEAEPRIEKARPKR